MNHGVLTWAIITGLVLGVVAPSAESAEKISNIKGPDAPVILGVITAVEGQVLTVRVPALADKQTIERKITITTKTTLSYLDIPDQSRQVPTVGYHIKGHADDDRRLLKSAILSPPLGEPVRLGSERLTMTNEELFAKTDTDHNGKVSYGEFSVTIEMSPKHGPNDFQAADKNRDGTLNPAEFLERLKSVTWWRLSRRTPTEFFRLSDKDANGALSLKEFAEIGVGHLDTVFPRYDNDQSGDLDEREVTEYLARVIGE